MLKIFKVALLSAVVVAGLSANDNLLSKVTNGVVADNATGVKMLNDGEMNQVVGGYYFDRKQYYLQLYRGDNQPAGAYAGVGAGKILDDMKKMGL